MLLLKSLMDGHSACAGEKDVTPSGSFKEVAMGRCLRCHEARMIVRARHSSFAPENL
jgi:hypothetical protein